MSKKKVKQIAPNTYIEKNVEDFQETVEETLTAETVPYKRIGRYLLLGAIAHACLLVVLFTLIVTVRYAIQL